MSQPDLGSSGGGPTATHPDTQPRPPVLMPSEVPESRHTSQEEQHQEQQQQQPNHPPEAAEAYEDTHVHSVYEAIAPHFSATRHKPWPLVERFLLSQPPGSVGLDVGCGNGKYLPVNPSVFILGSDRSASLVRLAATQRSGEVAVADGLALPYRPAAVDFVISIAVVHHLSTRRRRQEAIAALLACLRPGPGARALVYAWALEQSSSRRGWDESSQQDTLVPWVMRRKGEPDATFQRYYHLYREGELDEDVRAAGGTCCESGYEKDNWWVICSR
ncbi:tRNA (uracil-5-)-methyltransferase TRM9 [Purpureocillium lilacinum]|nr:tRNA (uracil-5-)-methyltransferase TRM9 [Purpureocillium lilacinum]OAQ80040.1 tRNA (uracil-5-)-methyltransferase TRM9 [Purpureocillium lilacinum]OAQ88556.1 tRNA (uracil-5-)-methyltransferase TRM9 [Purpureocillium lilacinum]GJN74296.1 tRNA methyltransferase, has a role in tRNA modification [Purpureocillium lilacinum]